MTLRELTKNWNKTQEEIAEILGKSRQTIINWNNLQLDNDRIDFVNMRYDLFNEGRLKLSDKKKKNKSYFSVSEPRPIFTNKNNEFYQINQGLITITVPLVPLNSHTKYMNEIMSDVLEFNGWEYISFAVDRVGKENYMGFKIHGDSMNGGSLDDVPDGALVLGREVGRHLWNNDFRQSPHGFIIITDTNILCKDILGIKDGKIMCHSRNTSPEYSTDFEIDLQEVKQIFNIIKRTF